MASGGVWKGEYLVVNLSDIRSGKRVPRIQRVRALIVDDSKGHVFPVKDLYDFVRRSALFRNANRREDSDSGEQTSNVHEDAVFEYDIDPSKAVEKSPISHRGSDDEILFADYWEIDEDKGIYVYHHVMMRTKMFVPSKEEAVFNLHELSKVRVTKGRLNGESADFVYH